MSELPDPRLTHVYRLEATLGEPLDIGDVSQGRRRIVPQTGGTFTRHAAARTIGCPERLVKNADDNWPTAERARSEVSAARRAGNRDNYRESPAE